MKIFRRITILVMLFGTSLFVLASNTHGSEGLLGRFHKQKQAPTTTTPTRAFLQRQCDALKRGIATIPGMRNVMANHQAKQPQ
jgi:hypothetical protein